jgi:hypothetical protein
MDEDMAVVPEDERPVRLAVNALLDEAAKGRPVVAYLNELQAGGHRPRCYHDPYAVGCDALWDAAVELGLARADEDRVARWLDHRFWASLSTALPVEFADRQDELGAMAWDAIIDSAFDLRTAHLEPDIDVLLEGLTALGREGDLRMVLLGDHGETPCVMEPITGLISCDHAGVPTWWVSPVPVYTVPSSLADDLEAAGLAEDGAPWSTINVTYGLFDAVAVPVPVDWPAPEPAGAASTWQCLDNRVRAARVDGEVSLRCAESTCEAMSWSPLLALTDRPTPIDPIPAEVLSWTEGIGPFPHMFAEACDVPEALMWW